MKILLYVLLAFGVFCFFSCKRTEKEQLTFLMKEWTRKEILFHDRAVFTIQGKDTLDKFPYASTYYKIVTYVDSLGCLSCKLQLLERINLYLANLHTSFLCNLIYPTFSRILLYSC